MLLALNDLRPGDLLFGLVRSPVGLQLAGVTQCPYSHVCVYLGSGQVADAAPGGVRTYEVHASLRDSYVYMDVFRYRGHQPPALSSAMGKAVCDAVLQVVGKPFYTPMQTILLVALTWTRIKLARRRFSIPERRRPAVLPGRFSCASLIAWALHSGINASEPGFELRIRRGLPINLPRLAARKRIFWVEVVEKFRRLHNQKRVVAPSLWDIPERDESKALLARASFLQARQTKAHANQHRLGIATCMPTDLLLVEGMHFVGSLSQTQQIPAE